ncbi:hypothetical protein scyTo_0020772 [Scyliorhinus torazame]|uniref:Uncharacterized protein n=1 Tax=Scyliorhinus torazame TaxID=75743 RepID=A0A401Q1U6_SCYTO|nr:hypothetical protein [Scyliorhinus torazame]
MEYSASVCCHLKRQVCELKKRAQIAREKARTGREPPGMVGDPGRGVVLEISGTFSTLNTGDDEGCRPADQGDYILSTSHPVQTNFTFSRVQYTN